MIITGLILRSFVNWVLRGLVKRFIESEIAAEFTQDVQKYHCQVPRSYCAEYFYLAE